MPAGTATGMSASTLSSGARPDRLTTAEPMLTAESSIAPDSDRNTCTVTGPVREVFPVLRTATLTVPAVPVGSSGARSVESIQPPRPTTGCTMS